MQAARRLYLYVMSAITLVVIATGLVLLLRVVLDGFLPDPIEGDGGAFDNSREQLSQAIAMLGVGVPVWAVHWRLVQRGLRVGSPTRDAERGSGIRAIYLTGILLISLLVWVPSAVTFLQWVVGTLLRIAPEFSYYDPLGSATVALVGFAIWVSHGLVRRRDLAAEAVADNAAWIPRLYLYGVAVGALLIAMTTLSSIVTSILVPPDYVDEGGYATYFLLQQVVTAIAWALVWLGHWWYAGRLARNQDWRGVEERASRTRVTAFVVVIVAAFIAMLGDVAEAGSSVIRQLLPGPDAGLNTALHYVIAPLVTAVPWLAVWSWHVRALRREPAAADPVRALHQERLVSHSIAAAGLLMGAAGAGWFIGLGMDVALGGQRLSGDADSLRYEIAQWLPVTVLGLATWAWFWRRVLARRRTDREGEANSTIRRTFLYLTLGVALVAALAAAAVILYRLVGLVINAGIGGDLASELSTPVGVLLAAGAVLLYHGLALREDQRLHAAPVTETVPAESAVPAMEPAPKFQRHSFALVGPAGADLDTALASVREALPPGFELVSEDG